MINKIKFLGVFGIYNVGIFLIWPSKMIPCQINFAMWSLILILSTVFGIYSALGYITKRKNNSLIFNDIGYLFSVNLCMIIGYQILLYFSTSSIMVLICAILALSICLVSYQMYFYVYQEYINSQLNVIEVICFSYFAIL